jgi:hypothetical protein
VEALFSQGYRYHSAKGNPDRFKAETEYANRDQTAQAMYGVSLHGLFQIALDSQANQQKLPTNEQLAEAVKQAQRRGQTAAAAQLAQILNSGGQLPPAKYP